VSSFRIVTGLAVNVTGMPLLAEERKQTLLKKELHGSESFLRRRQSLSYSRIPLHLMQNQRFITSSLVAYGCETWSLTLWQKHRLRVFENRLLTRIFRRRKVEVTGGLRKLHNEELHNL
jgi:hypothetical protein